MKCIECEYKIFEKYNSGPSRYYCTHPKAIANVGSRMICRTDRGSEELKTRTSPKWCPLRSFLVSHNK